MQNFQDAFETRKQSFVSAFSICVTVPSTVDQGITLYFFSYFVYIQTYSLRREIGVWIYSSDSFF